MVTTPGGGTRTAALEACRVARNARMRDGDYRDNQRGQADHRHHRARCSRRCCGAPLHGRLVRQNCGRDRDPHGGGGLAYLHGARARWGRRHHRAVELPSKHRRHPHVCSIGRRLHGRAEARRADALVRHSPLRVGRGSRIPSRCDQPGDRLWFYCGSSSCCASRCRQDRVHRVYSNWTRHRVGRVGEHEAGYARTGRKSPSIVFADADLDGAIPASPPASSTMPGRCARPAPVSTCTRMFSTELSRASSLMPKHCELGNHSNRTRRLVLSFPLPSEIGCSAT